MLKTLWTLLPLMAGALLMIVWAVTMLVAAVRWVIGQFQAGKAVSGVVALLLILLLPAASWLLSHSFFNKDVFRTADSKLDVLSGMVNRLFEGGGEEDASSGPAPDAAGAAAQPGDLSDEELMALAQEAYPQMLLLEMRFLNGDLLPQEEEHQELTGPDGETVVEGHRVKDYTTLEEVCQALDEVWYTYFAKGAMEAPSVLVRTRESYTGMYTEYEGAVYAWDAEIGSNDAPLIVSEIVSRDDREAVFRAHWDADPPNNGDFMFSLMFEDGRWKYGKIDIRS